MTQLPYGLTIALIVGSKSIWHWQFQLIQSLIEWKVIDVRGVISLGLPDLQINKTTALLHKLDGKIFSSPVSGFDLRDVSEVSGKVGIYTVKDLGEMEAVDVLINFSETVVPNYLIQKTSFGVLSPQFSDVGSLSSQSLGIDQYLNDKKQVSLSIRHQGVDGCNKVLGLIKPSFDRGSLSRNLSQYWFWLSHVWQRSLEGLLKDKGHSTALEQKTAFKEGLPPTVTKSLSRLSCNVVAKLKQKYLHQDQWVLLLKHLKPDSASDDGGFDFSSYSEISPPDDCFWADPFVISKDGHDYVFFEELPFSTERGHLSCMEVFVDGRHSEPKVVIQEPYHLSYPNVFEYKSEFYLIPESGDKGSIDLYHCTEFPYQWQYQKTLISDIHAYDSTLIEYQGRWWLFATVVPKLGLSGCEELHIFHADSPISTEWQPHLKNPVISDASRARPGGNFYIKEKQLYRVSQDCAGQYGAGININKVVQLDTENYNETLDNSYYPEWDKDLVALHTFNFNENIAVADVLRVKAKGFSL